MMCRLVLLATLLLACAPAAAQTVLPEVVGNCGTLGGALGAACTGMGDDGDAGSPAGLQPCPAGLVCCDTDGADDILFNADDQFCQPVNKPDWVGWGIQRSQNGSRQKNPGLRLSHVQTEWNKLEFDTAGDGKVGDVYVNPAPGSVPWGDIDSQINAAVSQGQWIFLKIFYGRTTPTFFMSGSCAADGIALNGCVPKADDGGPIMYSANYRFYYYRFIDALFAHLASLPATTRDRIVAVQVTVGNSGDPSPGQVIYSPLSSVSTSNTGETWTAACYDDSNNNPIGGCEPLGQTAANNSCYGGREPGTTCRWSADCDGGGTCRMTTCQPNAGGFGNQRCNPQMPGGNSGCATGYTCRDGTNYRGGDFDFTRGSTLGPPVHWLNWTEDAIAKYRSAIAANGLKIRLIVNAPFDGQLGIDWHTATVPDTMVKTGVYADDQAGTWRGTDTAWDGGTRPPIMQRLWTENKLRSFGPNGEDVRARFEWGPNFRGGYDSEIIWEAPSSSMYWVGLWYLTYGVDIPDTHPGGGAAKTQFWKNYKEDNPAGYCTGTDWSGALGNTCTNTGKTMRFFSKYSGFKSAKDSIGAFIAFRDPLRVDDIARWPESPYGLWTSQQGTRANNILADTLECPTCAASINTPAERGAYVDSGAAYGDVSPIETFDHVLSPGTCTSGKCTGGWEHWSGTGQTECTGGHRCVGGSQNNQSCTPGGTPCADGAWCSSGECESLEGFQDIRSHYLYDKDYGMFLTLLNPASTLGWWRVNWNATVQQGATSGDWPRVAAWPLDKNVPYGRFARSFEPGTVAGSKILLGLDDDFWYNDTGGLDGAYPIYARVVYYDDNLGGTWKLCYDGIADGVAGYKCLLPQTNSGGTTTNFREYTATIPAGAEGFDGNNDGPGGADVWLEQVNTTNTKFHMVELNRTQGFRTGYFGSVEAARVGSGAPSFCGNGIVEGDEFCDDGTAVVADSQDDCLQTCADAACGDGWVCDQTCPGGTCDYYAPWDAYRCSAGSSRPGAGCCQTVEQCDDGNGVSGDGCSDACAYEDTGYGSNLLTNGDFTDTTITPEWFFYSNGSATAVATTNRLVIDFSTVGDDQQLHQQDLTVVKDAVFRLQFDARTTPANVTDNETDIGIYFQHETTTEPFTPSQTLNIGSTSKTHTLNFTMSQGSPGTADAKMLWWYVPYGEAGEQYVIDNVRLQQLLPVSQATLTGVTLSGAKKE